MSLPVFGEEDWTELDQTGGPAGQTKPVKEPEPAAGHATGLSLEEVKAEILKYQKKYQQTVAEQEALRSSIEERQELTHQYQQRSQKLQQNLTNDQEHHQQRLEAEKEKVKLLQQDEVQLMKQIEEVKATLKQEEAQLRLLQEKVDVCSSAPELKVYFAGQTAEASSTPSFGVESRIVWPMAGGTALITFEEKDVARKILELKSHKVELGPDCQMVVEAEPVPLLVPRRMEVDTYVCPRRVLFSNLPRMDEDTLLNKLEIHFSKRKNRGGEVECCELRRDSWTVVLTFLEKDVAEGLTQTEYHDVVLLKTKHTVKVSPFINGELATLETEYQACSRTLLLTGIPDVMDQETLQDLLQIHFQKETNGGGEIVALLYNPLGCEVDALFQGTA